MNGIQEVSGSIPLISTKKHSISFEIECFSILFSLFCAGLFSPWTTNGQQTFSISSFLTVGRKKLWHLSKKKEQEANVYHTRFVCVWDVMKTAGKFQRQCAEACLMKVIWMNTTATLNKTFAVRLSIAEDQARCQMK